MSRAKTHLEGQALIGQMTKETEKIRSCGFNLQKLAPNAPSLLNKIPEEARESGLNKIMEKTTITALEVMWDQGQFPWFPPVITVANILMQRM